VIDAGANCGRFLQEISAFRAVQAVAVEPDPILAARLEDNRSRVFAVALGARDGPRAFYRSANPEASSLDVRIATAFELVNEIEVRVVGLRCLLDELEWNGADLLKLDVEGEETEILSETEGEVLQSFAQISVEFHDHLQQIAPASAIPKVLRRMAGLGFRCVPFSLPWGHHADVLFLGPAALQNKGLERRLIGIERRIDWLARVVGFPGNQRSGGPVGGRVE